MVRKWLNQNLPGALHFVTGNFLHRVPVFKQDACCQSFVDTFKNLLRDWPCKLIAYVLMPDHLHLIVNPQDGRIKEFTGKLKGLSARAIIEAVQGVKFKLDNDGSTHQVWQESFKAQPLLDDLAKDKLHSCQSAEGSAGRGGQRLSLVQLSGILYGNR
ncbi:MAG: transposase [Acidobacteriota bacterium]|nr:transposase [Acidobacteriota bacterium]